MNEKIQIKHYNKYLMEYIDKNIVWKTDDIRKDLKDFSLKLKAAIKVSLEDLKDKYNEEKPYMFSLAYYYGYKKSYLWSIVSTEAEFLNNINKLNDKKSHSIIYHYKYSPEESSHFDLGKSVFDILNHDYKTMVERQKFDSSEEDSFWNADEFDKFYEEFEETALRCLEDIKNEGFLDKINLKRILFQFYVKDYYSEDEEIKMFERLNKNNRKAIKEFVEW